MPMAYEVTISYGGDVSAYHRTLVYNLDLWAFYDVTYAIEKDMDDLVRQVGKLVSATQSMGRTLENISRRLPEESPEAWRRDEHPPSTPAEGVAMEEGVSRRGHITSYALAGLLRSLRRQVRRP